MHHSPCRLAMGEIVVAVAAAAAAEYYPRKGI